MNRDWIDTVVITAHAKDRYNERIARGDEKRIRKHLRKASPASSRQLERIASSCRKHGDVDPFTGGETRYFVATGYVVFAVKTIDDMPVLVSVWKKDDNSHRVKENWKPRKRAHPA